MARATCTERLTNLGGQSRKRAKQLRLTADDAQPRLFCLGLEPFILAPECGSMLGEGRPHLQTRRALPRRPPRTLSASTPRKPMPTGRASPWSRKLTARHQPRRRRRQRGTEPDAAKPPRMPRFQRGRARRKQRAAIGKERRRAALRRRRQMMGRQRQAARRRMRWSRSTLGASAKLWGCQRTTCSLLLLAVSQPIEGNGLALVDDRGMLQPVQLQCA
jgi:hypothetical protein